MEALAAVASVAGVLGLTIQSIEIIGKLEVFCDDFAKSDKVAAEFFHDLTMLARLLGCVGVLCTKMGAADY